MFEITLSIGGEIGEDETKKYYVYVHKDPEGTVFYVGKGTGRRAWAKDRHGLWKKYVERFDGKYTVEIVKDNLTEQEALDLENSLMNKYGGQLINWVNYGLMMDHGVYSEYWNKYREISKTKKEAKLLEKTDLEKAVELYRTALIKRIECEKIDVKNAKKYTGVAKEVYEEVMAEIGGTGDIDIINRLTICLKKLKKFEQIPVEVEKYLEAFPAAKNLKSMEKVLKRAKLI